jgi:hypothetical protein
MKEIRFISLKALIDRIMMSPIYQKLEFDSAIIWAVDAINIIEIPEIFYEKTTNVIVESYRAELPYDLVKLNKAVIVNNNTSGRISMKTSTDPFHSDYPNRNRAELTDVLTDYRMEGDFIFTAFEEGELQLSYMALPVDGDNYPMIPDNVFIIKTIEYYIQVKYLTIQWELGALADPRILEKKEQEYAYSVGQAQSQRAFENLDKMESLKNTISRMILLKNSHQTDYRGINNSEIRKHF